MGNVVPLRSFIYFLITVSRVDINKDKSVSAKEMQRWIMEKTEEHFQEAVRENKLSFHAVDPDGDGKLRAKQSCEKIFNKTCDFPVSCLCYKKIRSACTVLCQDM